MAANERVLRMWQVTNIPSVHHKCLIPILKAEYKNLSSIALRLLKQKSNEITNAEFIPSACHICNTDVMGLTNYASIRPHSSIKELKTEL